MFSSKEALLWPASVMQMKCEMMPKRGVCVCVFYVCECVACMPFPTPLANSQADDFINTSSATVWTSFKATRSILPLGHIIQN